jgi:cell division initiation protein
MTSASELDHVDTLEFGSGGTLAQRLSPDAVRRLEFGRSPIGRRGYNETDVEHFRGRVVHEIVQSTAERAALRQELQRQREEVQRLRDYFRRNRVDVDGAGGQPAQQQPATQVNVNIATVQAVNVMSQAQQAADQHIAQAEDYARRLVANARLQYEEILHRAHDQAQAAAAEAGRVAEEQQQQAPQGDPGDPGEMQHLQSRLAYMRTFAQVTQVQLRSILDALRQELDQLTELPAAPGTAPGTGTQATQASSAPQALSGPPAAGWTQRPYEARPQDAGQGRAVDVRQAQYQR